ncbi:DMT family transporter [Halocynthiibacter namhaensis]|uniref:DMT family transporter n=1 Tax=Halocynthiibacter namhaensis TaxID=1290553 RepID=UPI0009DEB676|nr:DMT family transporter [Halocynthiibacter namhaensis]
MLILPILAAVTASFGWATGIVLAQSPAQKLGAFEFTRIQLIACSAILAAICTVMGYWQNVAWGYWPSFVASICFGIVLGNLAMIECLRRGGPRRTELLLSLKAPLVAVMAYLWYGEAPSGMDLLGACIVLSGVFTAIIYASNEKSKSDATTGSLVTIVLLGVVATGFQGFGFLIIKPALLAGTEPIAASAIRLLGAAFLISVVALWSCPAYVPVSELIYAAFRSKAKGLFPPSDEWRRRGL